MLDIKFPGLGIHLKNIKDSISIFGFEIKFYGLIIAVGFIVGFLLACKEAKRTKQSEDLYLDFLIWLVIPAILGARLYYVIFNFGEYYSKGDSFFDVLKGVINIRNGGLAIYGGIIAGVIAAIIFCKKKKANFFLMADTIAVGLLAGQAIGRWGNFFNRECFGGYTDSIFRMNIPVEYFSRTGNLRGLIESGSITEDMAANLVNSDGMQWISVHPTFLYESLWNICLILFIVLYRKHKKFDGEIGLLYLWGYGLGRVWIEGLRTDSLMLPFGNIRVSQLLAALCVIAASVVLVKKRMDYARGLVKEKTIPNIELPDDSDDENDDKDE